MSPKFKYLDVVLIKSGFYRDSRAAVKKFTGAYTYKPSLFTTRTVGPWYVCVLPDGTEVDIPETNLMKIV